MVNFENGFNSKEIPFGRDVVSDYDKNSIDHF